VSREKPHATFPPGSAVRVRLSGRKVAGRKRALDGRPGTVVASAAYTVLVFFPAEMIRQQFRPDELEPAPPPRPRPRGKAK
jgi:hypothetical protein